MFQLTIAVLIMLRCLCNNTTFKCSSLSVWKQKSTAIFCFFFHFQIKLLTGNRAAWAADSNGLFKDLKNLRQNNALLWFCWSHQRVQLSLQPIMQCVSLARGLSLQHFAHSAVSAPLPDNSMHFQSPQLTHYHSTDSYINTSPYFFF